MNIICNNCGFEVTLPEGITEGFCGNCGTKVSAAETETVAEETVVGNNDEVIEETEPVVAEPVVEETESVVNEPIIEEAVPVVDEPVAEEAVPVVEEPVVEEAEPVVDEPVVEETKPVSAGTVVESFEADDNEPAPAPSKPASGLDGVIAKLPPSLQKIRPIPIIAAIIICMLIGFIGATVVIALIGNGSYKSAEGKTFDALTAVNSFGGLSGGGIDGGASTEFDVTYAPSEDILSLLSIAGLNSDDTEEFSADGIISAFGNSLLVDVTGHADSTDAHLVGSFNGNEATLAFPDATDYVYRFAITDTDDEDVITLDMNAYNKTIRAIEKEYFKIAERSYEVEKADELKGGGITVKADKYTFKFTKEDTMNFALFAIEEIRKNDNLVEYITKTRQRNDENFDLDDSLDDFASMIDDELYNLSDSEKESSYFRMKAWVYKGNIISREIDNIYGAEDVKISYTVLTNSKALYAKVSLSNGYEDFKVTADCARDGKYWGGDIRINTADNDESLKLTVKDMVISGKYLIGKATLRGTVSYDTEMNIALEFDKSDSGQQIVIDGKVADTDIGTLSLTYQAKTINSLNLPVYDPDDIIDDTAIDDGDEDMAEKYDKMNEEIREYFS